MSAKNLIWQIAVFVAVLVALNFFFGLHISIIGSLALTILLSLAFAAFRAKGSRR